jgi:hypothetical protein
MMIKAIRKLIKISGYLFTLAGIFSSPTAFAKIAGYNVIMIHGLQIDQLISPPTSETQIRNQSKGYWSPFWEHHAEAYLSWNSAERLEGNNSKRLFWQLYQIQASGLCSKGCLFVTHSTGDLIARYLIDHQADWFEALNKEPINIIATLDFAGAGGGTELASTAINFAASDAWWLSPVKKAIEVWLGEKLTPERLGILYDLQPSVARHISMNPSSVPRLRFIGGGNEYGNEHIDITKPFISGSSDGVVPTHSACGATQAEGYESCSARQGLDGEIKNTLAPKGFIHNHYPVLMGKKTNHSGSIASQRGASLALINNYRSSALRTAFSIQKFHYWGWDWGAFWFVSADYLLIPNSEAITMSQAVVNHFNESHLDEFKH